MTVLFVVLTIVVFLGLEAFVRAARVRRGIQPSGVASASHERTFPVRIPEGIFFARSHTWLSLFPSGKVRLGVDDFVGRLLDKPVVTYLKNVGESVQRGDPLLALREGDRALIIRAPMGGEILARNEEIERRPELLKELLFTDGWAYTIRPRRLSELRQMLLGDETREWIGDEFRRLRDVFAGISAGSDLVPALLQDGGPPVAGAMKHMSDDVWRRFEQEFLETH
jgi:glycine cleavage system H protein